MDELFNDLLNPEPFISKIQSRFNEIQPLIIDDLTHYENYGEYVPLVNTGAISINTSNLSKENIDSHFTWIYNIIADGIEQKKVHDMIVYITFMDNVQIRLSIFDYMLNLIMWKLPLQAGDSLTSNFLFFDDCITQDSIKDYIDFKFIDIHRRDFNNCDMNQMIDETIYKFMYIDDFAYYLINTINEKDTIDLMKKSQVAWDTLHFSTIQYPLEDKKDAAMDMTNKLIAVIKAPDSEHCLRDSFRAREGVNPKQFREMICNIATKPDGNGSIFSIDLDTNYMQEGVAKPEYYTIDSSAARQAQILNKENVGQSGAFSRKLRLNNMHAKIHPNPKYVCNSKRFLPIFIKDMKVLVRFKNRYFRFNPKGMEYKVSPHPERDNANLIGKTLYFRSPETCASHARGEGICYRCYGDLAYTNADINPGCMASELLSSVLTQRLLSAKHLLETNVKALNWVPEFKDIFAVNWNMIMIMDDFVPKKWKLIISSDDIYQESEYDEFDYNSCITTFNVMDPDGNTILIKTEDLDNLYISPELRKVMDNQKLVDDQYIIDFSDIMGIHLFMVNITNNGLSATLERCKATLDKQAIIKEYKNDIGLFTQGFINTIIEGGLDTDAVHCEVLISNQLRRVTDDLGDSMLQPEWEYPNEPYKIVTLDTALKENPSITTSLNYQYIQKQLFKPITFKKNKPGMMDLFFMEKPQEYMNVELDYNPKFKDDVDDAIDGFINPIYHVDENGNKL